MNKHALIIHSSGRQQDSLTRRLTSQVLEQLQEQHPQLTVTERDLATGMPFVNEQWIGANFTAADQRSADQLQTLSDSDQLVAELQQADWIIIGSPIYNFSVPAVLKAWVDQVARAQLTFRYTEQGPEGLLKNKQAILVMASGGVPIGSDMDFATPYLHQVMGFLGITDVQVLDATQHGADDIEHTVAQLGKQAAVTTQTGAQHG
jgi:FMN-dependent NADH-azoreductase